MSSSSLTKANAATIDAAPASFSSGGERERSRSPTNPVWQAAIERYYGELAKGGIKASTIDKDLQFHPMEGMAS